MPFGLDPDTGYPLEDESDLEEPEDESDGSCTGCNAPFGSPCELWCEDTRKFTPKKETEDVEF